MSKLTLVFILILFVSSNAAAGDYFISFEFGSGDVSVDQDQLAPQLDLQDLENVLFAGYIGYHFDSNVELEFGFSASDTADFLGIDLSDSLNLDETKASIGYRLYLADRFYITPKIGVGFWRVEAEEGIFLNPGPEFVEKQNGEGIFAGFDAAVEFSDHFGAYFGFVSNDYDFGDSHAFRFGLRYTF